MKIYELENRDDNIIEKLYIVWERSVRATHLFLKENDIKNISQYIRPALIDIRHLMITEIDNEPKGFMGIENKKLEMLFLSPELIGKGMGRKLIEYAVKNYDIEEVSVNEQNTNAYGFYKHIGFKSYKRDEFDELGNNFPIIHMKL